MKYTCFSNGTTIILDSKSLKYTIIANNCVWQNDGRDAFLTLKAGKKSKILSYSKLSSAKKINTVVKSNCIITRLSGFNLFGKKADFVIICTAKIIKNGQVQFSVKAENESQYYINSIYYPAPFNTKKAEKKSYAVDTMRQGLLIPDGYKENFLSTFALTKYMRKVNTGDSYHPFWGRVCGNNGFAAILNTPYDATMFSSFGTHSSFLNSVCWVSSLGHLSYERKVTFSFLKNATYNEIAKTYRNYLIENKMLTTIDEKIHSNPNVKYLIGSPVLHHRIFQSIKPQSKFYKKGGDNQVLFSTFENRAKQLEKIKALGLDKLYIHTDGWGVDGYDNKHPYVLPPCQKAGGYDGLKVLSDTCQQIKYKFGLHDQYRDFYYDSDKFDMNLAVENIDSTHPYCDIWDGGAHTWLCASNALSFVKDTYSTLKSKNINIDGTYLDVFAVMWGDQCFNKDHPQTREESVKSRRECFDYLRKNGIIVSSEEAAGQMINQLDLVHHAPYAVRPQGGGKAVGIPVPLTNLVYHDCLFVPWVANGIGGWGIPDNDSGKLHCILNAQTPYFCPFKDEKELKDNNELIEEINNVKEICNIEKELYNVEMIRHSFDKNNIRIQKAEYANGTSITVDFDKNTYSIRKK